MFDIKVNRILYLILFDFKNFPWPLVCETIRETYQSYLLHNSCPRIFRGLAAMFGPGGTGLDWARNRLDQVRDGVTKCPLTSGARAWHDVTIQCRGIICQSLEGLEIQRQTRKLTRRSRREMSLNKSSEILHKNKIFSQKFQSSNAESLFFVLIFYQL